MRSKTGAPMGRPRLSDDLEEVLIRRTISVPKRDSEAIEEWAWRLRLNPSELIRRLISKGLEPFYRSIAEEGYSPAPPSPTP